VTIPAVKSAAVAADRSRSRRSVLAGLVAAAAAFGLYWWLSAPQPILAVDEAAYKPDPVNGQTTFNAGGCSSCHAVPGQPDRTRLGGGLALPTPFGTVYVPNISPDPVDGIGRWSEAQFVRAVMQGVSPSGFHYFPAFPYPSYAKARIEDIRDLFAYLKTLPPVPGKVRDHDLRFPFNIRRNIGIWKLLFMDATPVRPDAARAPQWNRGNYLVNSLGHCAECHSARNFLAGIIASQRFAGAPDPDGKGWVPNITQKGIGDWTEKDIAYFLDTGQTPDGDSAGGSMVRVIRNLSQLSEADRAAIADYVKSLPPVEGPRRPSKAEDDDKS
jgi:mono/diheme cytochrome c family protein